MKLYLTILLLLFGRISLQSGEYKFVPDGTKKFVSLSAKTSAKLDFNFSGVKIPKHRIKPYKPVNKGFCWIKLHHITFVPQELTQLYFCPSVHYADYSVCSLSNKSPPSII